MTTSPEDLQPGAVEDAQAAFTEWQQGNQGAAISRMQTRVANNEPWALGLLIFLHTQQGLVGFRDALPLAERALASGMPWAVQTLYNNIMANLQQAPDLFESALKLLQEFPTWANAGPDVTGQAWNLLAQGRPADAVRLLSVRSSIPPDAKTLQSLAEQGRRQVEEGDARLRALQERAADVDRAANSAVTAIQKSQTDLETLAGQSRLLVSTVNSDAVNSLFKADADRNANESSRAWRSGIAVLSAAAVAAVSPLVAHYLSLGIDFTGAGVLAAHAGSATALAAVSGVLLSRAHNRDRAAQKARDLSTAMGTMISYSNQIKDEDEKQKFMLTMGHLVLQSHLQSGDATGADDSLSGLAALLTLLRANGKDSSA